MSWFTRMFKSDGGSEHNPQTDKGQDTALSADEADEVLADEHKSLIMQLIRVNGLSSGVDLSKVVLPTFILEPRSLLEKLGDICVHPELLADIPRGATPQERILRVVRWYISAFHRRPKGVKKPFNPVLGESFRGNYTSADGSATVTWIAEQVSHHPPVSAFFAALPDKSAVVQGTFAPKSRFLGNSAASIGEGGFELLLPGLNEVYAITWPTVYVRGVIFGTLLMEVGGPVRIRCPTTGHHADLEFVVKGYFSGTRNAFSGSVYRQELGGSGASPRAENGPKEVLASIEGTWTTVVQSKDARTGATTVLFDTSAAPMGKCEADLTSDPTAPYESTQTWAAVAKAITANDQRAATEHKTAIEEQQREVRAARKAAGTEWKPRFFSTDGTGDSDCVYIGPEAVPLPSPTYHQQ